MELRNPYLFSFILNEEMRFAPVTKKHEGDLFNNIVYFFYSTRLSNMIRNALKVRKTPLREFSTSYKSRFTQKSFFTGKNKLALLTTLLPF